MLYYLVFGITYAVAAALLPGPLQSYLISQTLSKGWRQTFPAVCAPLISDGPIIVVIVILLSHVPQLFINLLQCVGGIFLLFLAFKAWKSLQMHNADQAAQRLSSRQSILEAVIVNLLNPGPYLSWSLVMGPLLLKGWRETPINGIALLVGFYLCMVVCLIGIIFLFAFAKSFGPRITRAMIVVSTVVLVFFGIHQFWSGLKFFWSLL